MIGQSQEQSRANADPLLELPRTGAIADAGDASSHRAIHVASRTLVRLENSMCVEWQKFAGYRMSTMSLDLSVISVALAWDRSLFRTLSSLAVISGGTSWELIVVSPDQPKEPLPQLGCRRFEVLRDTGKGPYPAMNMGAAAATGEFVLFLNSGDCLAPEANTERAIAALRHSQSIWGMGSWHHRPERIRPTERSHLRISPETIAKGQTPICHQAVLMKTQSLQSLGLFNGNLRVCADLEIFVRLAKEEEPLTLDCLKVELAPWGISETHPWQTLRERFVVLASANLLGGHGRRFVERLRMLVRYVRWKALLVITHPYRRANKLLDDG